MKRTPLCPASVLVLDLSQFQTLLNKKCDRFVTESFGSIVFSGSGTM